jgi:hypothetical protein
MVHLVGAGSKWHTKQERVNGIQISPPNPWCKIQLRRCDLRSMNKFSSIHPSKLINSRLRDLIPVFLHAIEDVQVVRTSVLSAQAV